MEPEKVEENSSQIEDLNTSQPKTMGARLALLCSCPKCVYYFVTPVYERTLMRNIELGSKVAPLRAYCPNPDGCNHHIRLHSKRGHTNIHAEVPYSRLNRVQNLRDTAEAANMDEGVSKGDLYALWNENTGYNGVGVPLPFRKWHKRQVGA
jgi:hypothetical protein